MHLTARTLVPAFSRRALFALLGGAALAAALLAAPAARASETPDAWVNRLSNDVLQSIKNDKSVQAGNTDRIMQLVDEKIMPNVNFRRMTASAVGPGWRQASAEQRMQLEQQFKLLLIRTYAGALKQVKSGSGEPVQLDYRLEKAGSGAGWRIYDLNVMGVWLIANYRPQFSQQVNQNGINGLIASLTERNKCNAAR